jgi:putative ABC transport system permease protein
MDIVSGRFFKAEDRGVVVLELAYANMRSLNVSDMLRIAGVDFKIVGIVAPAVRPVRANVYMHISDLSALISKRGWTNHEYAQPMNVILVESTNAKEQDKAVKAVRNIDRTLEVSSFSCYKPAAKVMGMNEKALWMVTWIIGVGVVIFSVFFQLSFVVSREHDIGIFKVIGWSNKLIIAQILVESIIQSLFGGILGILFSIYIIYVISLMRLDVSVNLIVLPGTITMLIVLTFLGGIVAGIFPALYLMRRNTAEILRRL